MQYIFLVETTKCCKSDELYIRAFINHHYSYPGDKLTFEYMNGKTNYNRFEKIISNDIKRYSGESIVFICYDIDNPKEASVFTNNTMLNRDIENYAKNHNIITIWFNPDVENVFIGKTINNDSKKKTAEKFYAKEDIQKVKIKSIENKSNIKNVLDRYFNK